MQRMFSCNYRAELYNDDRQHFVPMDLQHRMLHATVHLCCKIFLHACWTTGAVTAKRGIKQLTRFTTRRHGRDPMIISKLAPYVAVRRSYLRMREPTAAMTAKLLLLVFTSVPHRKSHHSNAPTPTFSASHCPGLCCYFAFRVALQLALPNVCRFGDRTPSRHNVLAWMECC
jgi:hypothetical protein